MSRISVLMLTYNRAEWLREALAGVLASRNVDLELVLCDNGSTDHTAEVIRSVADDPRVKTFRMEQNNLLEASRLVREMATGDYFINLPDDDVVFDPDWLGDAVRALDEDPGAGLCWSWTQDMDENGDTCGIVRGILKPHPVDLFDANFAVNYIPMSACVYRRRFKPTFQQRYFGELDLWLNILREMGGVQIHRVTTRLRLHGGSESNAGYYSTGFLEANHRIWGYWIKERGFRPSEACWEKMLETWASFLMVAFGCVEPTWRDRFFDLYREAHSEVAA